MPLSEGRLSDGRLSEGRLSDGRLSDGRLSDAGSARDGPIAGPLPFTGRLEELSLIQERVRAREPTIVIGEAGSGKTRLVQQMQSQLDGDCTVLVGRSSAGTRHAPYAAFREIGSRASRVLDPLELHWNRGTLNDLGVLFPSLDQVESTPHDDLRRHKLWLASLDYWRTFVDRSDTQLVLVVEDVHWSDPESVSLFRWMAEQSTGLALIATSRLEIPAAIATLPTLPLGPLAVEDISDALDRLQLSGHSAADVHRATGGHALRFREWVTSTTLGLSEEASGATARRLDEFDPATRRVLGVAALVEDDIDLTLLAAIEKRSHTQVLDDLQPALDAGVMRLGDLARLRFQHDSYREVAAGLLSVSERAAIHRQILNELIHRHGEEPERLSRLAHHATAASADGDRSEAFRLNLAAGVRAHRVLAPKSAQNHLSMALELAQMDGDRTSMLTARLALGLSLTASSDPSAHGVLLQVYGDADHLEDHETYALAALAQPAGTGPVGISHLGDAAAAARLRDAHARLPSDHPLQARLLAELAMQQHATLSEHEYFALVEAAEACAVRFDDPTVALPPFISRHGLRRPIGRLESTRSQVAERLANSSGADPSFVALVDIAIVSALRQGDIPAVSQLLRHLESEMSPLTPVAHWTVLRIQAAIAHAMGNISAMERLSIEAVTKAAGTRYEASAEMYFGFQVASLMRDRMMAAEAGAAIDQWTVENPSYLAFRAARAWQRADLGDRVTAREDLDHVFSQDLVEWSTRVEGLALLEMATSAAVQCEHQQWAERGRSLMEPFRDEWIVLGAGTVIRGPALRAIAMASSVIGDHDRALTEITLAETMTRQAGTRLLEWDVIRDRGFILRRHGDHPAAIDAFEHASMRYRSVDLTAQADWLDGQIVELRSMMSTGHRTGDVRVDHAGVGHFRREGDVWHVGVDAEGGSITNVKGLAMLRILLERPRQPITAAALSHAVEVGVGETRAPGNKETPTRDEAAPGWSDQPVLDRAAIAAYRGRLEQLAHDLDQADARGDAATSERISSEIDVVRDELRRSTGLGGRSRSMIGDNERARVRVTKSIKAAVRKIEAVCPALSSHLELFVHTGSTCVYQPDPRSPIEWEF